MRMTLFLVRHGETIWNHENRYQGQRDIPLNEDGKRQARLLARRLRNIDPDTRFDSIWSSDLARAGMTAEAAAEHLSLPVRTTTDLREMDFGRWEGLTFPQIERLFPENVSAYRRDPVRTACAGGESFQDVLSRTAAFLDQLRSDQRRKPLIFAHGGSIKAVLCHLLAWDPSRRNRLAMGNTGLTVVEVRDDWARLIRYNDMSHLEAWAWREGTRRVPAFQAER